MNVYFDYTNLTPNSLARSSDVDARFLAVQSAFDKLPDPEKLQQDRQTFAVDSGTANALVVALDFPLATYVVGLEITALVAVTNSGPTTINVDGVGVKTVKRSDGTPLGAGDLVAGTLAKLIYDGTAFRLMGASESTIASFAAQAAASASAAANSATTSGGHVVTALGHANNAAASASAAATSATNAANSAVTAANASAGKADKNNATFTGTNPVLPGAPTAPLQAATKAYVDAAAFAAGSAYSADGASLTLTTGTFSLTPIANARLLGNVSGGTLKPYAITGAELATFIPLATTGVAGLHSPADKAKLDAITGSNTGDQTSVSGNAGTATALQTARTIAISGAVTGTATSFNGSANITIPITAMNMDGATSGTLAVARGGTGCSTATGSGSAVVLHNSPTLTGTPLAPTAAVDTYSAQIATTAFVLNQGYAKPTGANSWSVVQHFLSSGSISTSGGAALECYSNTDVDGSYIQFHRAGRQAVNAGLDTDNKFKIGGWSWANDVFVLDGSGNLAVKGSVAVNGVAVSLAGHTHSIANVTGLQGALDAKSDTSHTHSQYAPTSAPHLTDNVYADDCGFFERESSIYYRMARLDSPGFVGTPTAPTQVAGNNSTRIATTAFVDRLRSLPARTDNAANAAASDRGGLIFSTGSVTIPSGVFAAGDVFTITNFNTGGTCSIIGSGVTLRLAGTATTGTRTLAQMGVATILFVDGSNAIVTGNVT